MVEYKHENTTQHTQYMEAYKIYKQDMITYTLILSNMKNDLISRFEKHYLVMIVWDVVKIQFSKTSATRLY